MELRRFYAEDMSHGMRTVKKEMGSGAVIVETNRINDQVEILAALDFDESLYDELIGNLHRGKELPETGHEVAADINQDNSFRLEMLELRTALKTELAELSKFRDQREAERKDDPQPLRSGRLDTRLRDLGLSQDVSRAVSDQFDPGDNPKWDQVFKSISKLITVGNDEILTHGGIVALVGSTGVGKTTTVAKLAAQYTYRHGQNKVALITTDGFRIGGQEQLATFGRALGVPVSTASSTRELSLRIREYSKYDLVLIDTAGISQRDIGLAHHLQSLRSGHANIQPYLVISGTSELTLTQEVIEAFYKIPLKGAIVTKIDEAASLGPVLSGVIRHKLPVMYLCDGQDIPKDLNVATRSTLLNTAKEILEETRKRERLTAQARLEQSA